MAKRGTLLGEVERGWARFRKLPLVAKGPIIAVTVLVVMGIIGAIMRAGDSKNGRTNPTPTAAENAVATPSATVQKSTPEPTATPPSPTPVPSPTPLVGSSRGSPLPIGTNAMVGVCWDASESPTGRPGAEQRVGVAGIGRIGTMHSTNLASLEQVNEVLLFDPTPGRTAQLAGRLGAST